MAEILPIRRKTINHIGIMNVHDTSSHDVLCIRCAKYDRPISKQKKVEGRTRICTERQTDRKSDPYLLHEFCSRGVKSIKMFYKMIVWGPFIFILTSKLNSICYTNPMSKFTAIEASHLFTVCKQEVHGPYCLNTGSPIVNNSPSICLFLQRTIWNSNINSLLIPWSVNLFYSTNFQFLVMLTLNDIYHVVLRVKGVLCCEHWRKLDRFLDPIIPIFYWQRHVLFRHE